MSNILNSLVQQKIVGSATKKSVMLYLADKSADDGSGIWVSKSNIARDLELTRRSVQRSISDLVSDGLILEVGEKTCKNGFTIEYEIQISSLNSLPSTRDYSMNCTRDTVSHVTESHGYLRNGVTCTRDTVSHKPSLEPSLEPSISERGEEQANLLSNEDAPHVDPLERTLGEFYDIYPKRSDKKHSTPVSIRPVLKSALKKISAEELLIAARNYADYGNHENGRFARKAIYWLREEEWEKYLTVGSSETSIDPQTERYRRIISEWGGK